MISVVVPVKNEAARLPALLGALASWSPACGVETIVVDGDSTDGTLDVVRRHAGVRAIAGEPGRAKQLNRGAEAASGDWLWFLHADVVPCPDAFAALERAVAEGMPEAGGFRLAFDADRPLLRWIAWWSDRRAARGIVYGDQGLFVKTARFRELGGFREDEPMEDLDFSLRARRRIPVRRLDGTIVASSRRFDRHGDLRTGWESLRLTWARARGVRRPESDVFFTEVR